MADLWRNADDPLGVAFDLMVPCPDCEGEGGGQINQHWFDCGTCADTHSTPGLIPNPALTEPCETCGGSGTFRQVGTAPLRWRDIDCEGRGFRVAASVRVPERVPVIAGDPWEDGDHDDREGAPSEFTPMRFIGVVGSSVTQWWRGEGTAWARQDISHLWDPRRALHPRWPLAARCRACGRRSWWRGRVGPAPVAGWAGHDHRRDVVRVVAERRSDLLAMRGGAS